MTTKKHSLVSTKFKEDISDPGFSPSQVRKQYIYLRAYCLI